MASSCRRGHLPRAPLPASALAACINVCKWAFKKTLQADYGLAAASTALGALSGASLASLTRVLQRELSLQRLDVSGGGGLQFSGSLGAPAADANVATAAGGGHGSGSGGGGISAQQSSIFLRLPTIREAMEAFDPAGSGPSDDFVDLDGSDAMAEHFLQAVLSTAAPGGVGAGVGAKWQQQQAALNEASRQVGEEERRRGELDEGAALATALSGVGVVPAGALEEALVSSGSAAAAQLQATRTLQRVGTLRAATGAGAGAAGAGAAAEPRARPLWRAGAGALAPDRRAEALALRSQLVLQVTAGLTRALLHLHVALDALLPVIPGAVVGQEGLQKVGSGVLPV
jgi:hypothetical protein